MKHLYLILFLLVVIPLSAKKRVIENPDYEACSSGINEIVKIEWDENETRLHVKTNFIPNWWVMFTKEFYITDPENDEKLHPIDIIGGEFDKEIYMPASGDSTFIVIFPPLGKKTQKIDYTDDEKKTIWGISLQKPKKKKNKQDDIPVHVQQWLDEEVQKSSYENSQLLSGHFFTPDGKIRVVGYIKGYDPRFDLGVGLIYANNHITREDIPVVVELEPDGRFMGEFPASHPGLFAIYFENRGVDFYAEPNMVTAITLDWEDFLRADRFRDRRYKFESTCFSGPLGQLNQELISASLKAIDWRSFQQKVKEQSAEDFKSAAIREWDEAKEILAGIIRDNDFLPETREILKRKVDIQYGSYIFDFAMSKYFNERENPDYSEPEGYYDFLLRFSLHDPLLMVTDYFSTFINRLEYMSPFRREKANDVFIPEKSFYDFLEESEIVLTKEEKVVLEKGKKLYESYKHADSDEERQKYSEEIGEATTMFIEKYEDEYNEYRDLYIFPMLNTLTYKNVVEEWQGKDAVLKNNFNAPETLIGDIIKIRALEFIFENYEKEHATSILNYVLTDVREPFLKAEASRIYHNKFSGDRGYQLPEGKAADVFRQIIEPYKGKYLLVDFWGIFCGPCIHNIKEQKEQRAGLKNDPDMEFIFITSHEESPEDRYNAFVEEQELEHSFLLSKDDYRYLRALFRFNGIPRYILVDRDGTILNDKYSSHNFVQDIKRRTGREDV